MARRVQKGALDLTALRIIDAFFRMGYNADLAPFLFKLPRFIVRGCVLVRGEHPDVVDDIIPNRWEQRQNVLWGRSLLRRQPSKMGSGNLNTTPPRKKIPTRGVPDFFSWKPLANTTTMQKVGIEFEAKGFVKAMGWKQMSPFGAALCVGKANKKRGRRMHAHG
jgi:hypothetical protein